MYYNTRKYIEYQKNRQQKFNYMYMRQKKSRLKLISGGFGISLQQRRKIPHHSILNTFRLPWEQAEPSQVSVVTA
jgi:hypothetical protein